MRRSKDGPRKMGLNATWSMAVGGMVGGGIFSVLGVVVHVAGAWAWLSFVLGGLIALFTGLSYADLIAKHEKSGGIFTFLHAINYPGLAGSMAWLLIMGYVLTISVYAFTFAHYTDAVFELGPWFVRGCSLAIVAGIVGINLVGVGESAWLEIVTVWGKLAILLALAGIGLAHWSPGELSQGIEPVRAWDALTGAAVVFMAYEGFQLLAYDYDAIENPRRNMERAIVWAILAVIGTYVAVTLGATMLVGADTIVARKEVALAAAGQAALGTPGLVAVSVAAAFSTGSAINATVFATARLARDVAKEPGLPGYFAKENARGVPGRAVVAIGTLGGVLSVVGTLHQLVEAASLAFLFTFATVNFVAARTTPTRRWVSWVGAAASSAAGIGLTVRLAFLEPWVLVAFAVLVVTAGVGRWLLVRYQRSHGKA